MTTPTRSNAPRIPHLYDDNFIGKLGIISVQTRIEEDNPLNTNWNSVFVIGEHAYQVEGMARDYGRPRGVDTDIFLALETLYLLNGCPEDRVVRTTAYELIQMVYGRPSAALYSRLRATLLRLWRVAFLVQVAPLPAESAWDAPVKATRMGGGGANKIFHSSLQLIESIEFWTTGAQDLSKSELAENDPLRVTLSKPLAASLSRGGSHQLSLLLHSNLRQPVARAMYRLLEAHRPANNILKVGLTDWASVCGILTDHPDRVRRTLQPAHKELCDQHYLESAEFEGRGAQTRIIYRFRAPGSADPALVALLLGIGSVTRVTAEGWAIAYPELIEDAVRFVKMQRDLGKIKQSESGYLHAVLKDPGKYDLKAAAANRVLGSNADARRKKVVEQQRKADEEHEARYEAERAAASPAAQWKSVHVSLKSLSKQYLCERGFKALEDDCLSGKVSAAEVHTALFNAKTPDKKQEVLAPWIQSNSNLPLPLF